MYNLNDLSGYFFDKLKNNSTPLYFLAADTITMGPENLSEILMSSKLTFENLTGVN